METNFEINYHYITTHTLRSSRHTQVHTQGVPKTFIHIIIRNIDLVIDLRLLCLRGKPSVVYT